MNKVSMTLILAGAALLAACGQQEAPPAADAAQTASAAAEGSDPAAVIKARQANLKKLGGAMKAMNDELKKPEPSLAVFQASAATISALAPQLHGWFPAGTGPGAGAKTDALPVVWNQRAEFEGKADTFAAEAQRFDAAVQTGDLAAIRAAAPKLGATCKGCHETFRAD